MTGPRAESPELAPSTGRAPQRLRIAIAGPTHPSKGGVAAHTTVLAHQLHAAGHKVVVVSWKHQYPSALYPGEQSLPAGSPDVQPFPNTSRVLSWASPASWFRAGRLLRKADVIILAHVVPALIPAHLTLMWAAGIPFAGKRRREATSPRTIVIAHNVLPHERFIGQEQFLAAFLHRADVVFVHSEEQAELAAAHGALTVKTLAMPPHLPGAPLRSPNEPRTDGPRLGCPEGRVRLLSFGIVRDYKGVDLLLDALRDEPGLSLTIAGELWGAAGRRVRELADDPRLAGRVVIRNGYVRAEEIEALMASHDVLALTYRSATASQNVLLAHHYGLPVLASSLGTFPAEVRHGLDGLLVTPSDREELLATLRRLANPAFVARLREGVQVPDLSSRWGDYIRAVEDVASSTEQHL